MHINLQGSKAVWRKEMKEKRNLLNQEQILTSGMSIAARLNELLPVQKAQVIMGFAPMRNEVDLESFYEQQSQLGKTIVLPRVEGDQLKPVEWQGWQETKVSPFGVREPLGEAYPLKEIDVVIVPGLAFDPGGFRVGYGRGFYDRFLPQLRSDAFKCGVCYEFQIVDSTFPHEKDVPVHWIVTDKSELVINWDYF